MFTKKDLRKLIIPLILEQILLVAVGMADTIMISTVGEDAVSSISLVDNINILLINIFASLATGGAVVIGYSLGTGSKKRAGKVAEQLVLFTAVLSVIVMIGILLAEPFILNVVFGDITPVVKESAQIYLNITAYSVPFIALYNAGAAIYRSMANSKVPMLISGLMNGINVIGNAVLIYGFSCGVEGAAIPTLISRIVAAIIIIVMLFNVKLEVHLRKLNMWRVDLLQVRKICQVGVPNGLENSFFQLGKIMVLSMITGFGTSAVAANAVSNNIALFQIIPGMAISLATITVISRCIGSGAIEEAKYYKKLLMRYVVIGMIIVNSFVILILPFILNIYHLSDMTSMSTKYIVIYHGICCIFIWTPSFVLPNVLRAAGDVRYPLVISMLSMWIFRLGFSYVLGDVMNWGVFGVWVAMTIDWVVRAIFFTIRYHRGKWESMKIV